MGTGEWTCGRWLTCTMTIPRAVLLSIGITTLLYVLVGLSAVALVDWRVLDRSASPLAEVARIGWGPLGSTVLGAIALFSTTNTGPCLDG